MTNDKQNTDTEPEQMLRKADTFGDWQYLKVQ